MKLRTITSRAAVAGAATALIAGGLVAATGTAADAATADTTYTCTLPGPTGPVDVPLAMHIDVPLLPPSAPAGFPVNEGLLSFDASLDVPAAVAAALDDNNIDGGKSDNFTVSFGNGTVAAPVVLDTATPNDDGSVTFSGQGSNEAFSLPKAGTYDVSMPASFALIPTSGGSALPTSFPCTSSAPGSLGDVVLTKQASTTTAKAVKRHKVNVTVKNEYSTPTGKVVAKVGKKSFTEKLNRKGKAVFAFPKALKGKKAVFSYKGDGFTQASKTGKITIK